MPRPEDPVVTNGRREALLTFIVWLAALAYTVGYCYLFGYGRSADSLKFVLWFPDWVFWGIVVPWLACVVITSYFAFRIMGDEPLGPETPTADDRTSEVTIG